MGVLYLLRHGQASFGTDDYDRLSDLGHRQAEILGRELKARGVTFDVVVSGSLRRQRETAASTLAGAGVDAVVETDARWDEYDFGDIIEWYADTPELVATPASRAALSTAGTSSRVFQGLLDVGLAGWISADAGDPSGRGGAGTGDAGAGSGAVGHGSAGAAGSWSSFRELIATAVRELVPRIGPGRCALVFTSAGPIMTACADLLGLGPDACVSVNRVMINASITKIVSGRGGTNLVSLNEHSHLDALGREYVTYR